MNHRITALRGPYGGTHSTLLVSEPVFCIVPHQPSTEYQFPTSCSGGGFRRLPLKELQVTNMHSPPHPGEVPREWLADISATDTARRLGQLNRCSGQSGED
jgi:hypothetical protein